MRRGAGRPPPGVVHADDIVGCVFVSYERVDRAYAQSLAGELCGDVFPLLIDVQYADVRTGRLPAPGFYARLDRAQPLSLARSLRSFGQIAIQCRQIHQARVVLCSQRLCGGCKPSASKEDIVHAPIRARVGE